MSLRTNRRDFLKGSAAAGIGFWVAGRMTWAQEHLQQTPNERVNFACIGVGGKGSGDTDHVASQGNLVAICDIDEDRLNKKSDEHPKAKKFTDYRKMLDEMGKEIDAVTISTPDHNHAAATMMAIKMGKHVYTQKPLAHDVWECRQLRLAAKEHKIASQMGNQGTSLSTLREAVELVQAGVIGAVKEAHVWTNRPIWPQSPKVTKRPDKVDEVPSTIHWDEWIGTAPMRPYAGNRTYHDFNWRGWWDFGTGALGDMGCHTANMPFMALKLGHPKSLRGESEPLNPETYPGWAHVAFDFPARGEMPPVTVHWYEGHKDGILVHPPMELAKKVVEWNNAAGPATSPAAAGGNGRRGNRGGGGGGQGKDNATGLPQSGSILVGEKGILYSPSDYAERWVLLPKDKFADYKAPPQTLPRHEGGNMDVNQKKEWIAAIKGGRPALGNFDYAGMLAEFIVLGNIAIRAGGQTLEWDGPNMKFPNAPSAERWLRREYRKPYGSALL
jgi:predicted dehydrogenase